MLGLANKLLSKAQSRISPNLWLTSSPNWPNRTMNFPNGFAYFEGIYRNWRVGPRRDLQSWNWILRSPLSIDNTTKGNHYLVANVGGIQNSSFSRRFSDKPCVIDENSIKDHLIMQAIIHAYQSRGHLVAEIDPLLITRGPHLKTTTPSKEVVRELTIPSDLNKVFVVGENTFIGGGAKTLPAHEIIKRLEEAYCKSIGVEFMFITDYDQIQFLKERFETPGWRAKISNDEKKILLKRLTTGHHFETFLTRKYPSVKRFGLGGCEVLIPALRTMVDTASAFGVEHFIFGMAHRGRLNVLANVIEKSLPETLALFRSLELEEAGTGDVKYHLGVTTSRTNNKTKKPVNFTLCANPSHLECVCPIAVGKSFALQEKFGGKEKVWPILFHGDAATAGQGVVYETFHLSELPCYSTNGAMHVIINNQIGFTTDPRMSRSSVYCTAVGKVLAAPIIHVNGDDPEAVIFAMIAATDFKHKFKHSVVLDIVCYRRHGHSEFDEPMFTQPIMYKKIKALKSCLDQYSEKLIKENVVKKDEVDAILNEYDQKLEKALKESEAMKAVDMKSWVDSPWHDFFKKEKDPLQEPITGVKKEVLLKVGQVVSTPPPDFEMHKLLERILAARKKMIAENSVDFALGEAFAFGSLLEEGVPVRMTGQDSERGTFSHRHTIYHHQSKDKISYTPLKHLSPGQAKFKICNSSLSEFGVLGFELGFSSVSPNQLVLWEAQFGDFANTAQCIIDQFISSGEVKWRRQIGLVMLLPHGMEGQGPEHSSCRPERFLQMCADDAEEIELNMPKQLFNANWFIVNPTTPASLFHALRRQVKLNYRKPLVIFSPKSLLRDPTARSSIDDMVEGTKFKPYLKDETIKDGGKVKRMYLCSGKIYYGLMNERNNRTLNETIAISRVEQLYPFPYAEIIEDANRYPNAQVFWVQEEHKNQGFWDYTKPRLISALPKKTPIKYFGRGVSPAPATGVYILHLKELKDLMDTCFAM